jgi:hypothetical protein
MAIDIEKVIQILHDRGLLKELENKRLTTNKLPMQLYIRLCESEVATGKDISNNISTALSVYTGRNKENHDAEVTAKALLEGKDPEEFLVDKIQERIEKIKRKQGGGTSQSSEEIEGAE